jgi:hypothetical protein
MGWCILCWNSLNRSAQRLYAAAKAFSLAYYSNISILFIESLKLSTLSSFSPSNGRPKEESLLKKKGKRECRHQVLPK